MHLWQAAGALVACSRSLAVFTCSQADRALSVHCHSVIANRICVCAFVCLCSGQENWLRYISGMGRHRHHFYWSTVVAYTILTPLASTVAGVGWVLT